MAIARKHLVDAHAPLYYHITSRCVQSAWLLGTDRKTRKSFDHRRAWLIRRLEQVTPAFAVNVETYAVMSNHFHLVVYYDPLLCETWSDEEVARRWFIAHPTQISDPADAECRREAIELLVADEDRVEHCRASLGSLSEFMKCIKQPIASRANKESDTGGHFWSGRFYSGAILSEEALLTTMAYVDLNPVRAKIVRHLEECEHTGLSERLRALDLDPKRLDRFLEPCFKGAEANHAKPSFTLKFYRRFLEELVDLERQLARRLHGLKPVLDVDALTREERWHVAKQSLRGRPRAIGSRSQVASWFEKRGFRFRGTPLPDSLG